jgi:hypothetical protein
MVHDLMIWGHETETPRPMFLQVVSLDLDGHLHTILGLGSMYLSQRRRRQRLVIELSKEFA